MQTVLKIVFPLVYFGLLILPAWIFFDIRGGTGFLQGLDTPTTALAIFPLIGLYALTLVWLQIILGTLMPFWQKLWPKFFYFHRAAGVFALLFALTHPALRTIGIGPAELMKDPGFGVAPEHQLWLLVGYLQLFLLILTVTTAVFMRSRLAGRNWRKLHYANYAVFVLGWFHSWFLGSDVQTTNLKYLWYFFAVTAVVAVIMRLTVFSRRTMIWKPSIVSDSSE